jgi:23S rRNA pseudouridine2457 synthase
MKKMSNLLLFNKPFGVLTQFRASADKITLARYIDRPNFYPAGRLDEQSEGLLLLTDDGKLQARIAHPKFKLPKTYWAQVEGVPSEAALEILRDGVSLKDGRTRPAEVQRLENAPLPPRVPPIRVRKNIPDSWLELTITEGKNRQVRRMTAAVGFPTLRLFRTSIGPWNVKDLPIAESRLIKVNLPN